MRLLDVYTLMNELNVIIFTHNTFAFRPMKQTWWSFKPPGKC